MAVNLDTHQATIHGQPVHLTGKEYAILELLILRRGAVLSKEQFLSHLYGGMDEPEIKIIDVFICKLRKKLSQAGAPNIIGTVWGRGYTIRSAFSTVVLPVTKVSGFRSPFANDTAGAARVHERELIQA